MKKSILHGAIRVFVGATALTLVSACATQPGTIDNRISLKSNDSALIGARQRAILNIEVGEGSRPGLVNPERIVCAEPSPDVAAALAQSFGFGISILGQGSGSATIAQSEGVAQLAERTVSIQLLRDQMYRACESYANGAITGTTYNLIMSKNNDAMVSLMLGETAGGAFGRSLAAIGGSASAEAKASTLKLSEIREAIDQANDEVEQAQEEEADAKEKLEDKKDIAATDGAQDSELQDQNNAEVEEAEKEVAAAEEKLRQKKEQKAETEATGRAEITKLIGAGSIAATPNVGIAEQIQEMQRNFLREDSTDEFIAACLIELGLAPHSATEVQAELAGALKEQITANISQLQNKLGQKTIDSQTIAKSAENLEKSVATQKEILNLDRTSMLAIHCRKNLNGFIYFTKESDDDLERRRIALDVQKATLAESKSRSALMESYQAATKTCAALQDKDIRQSCLMAAAAIVQSERDIAAGQIAVIQAPSAAPILPLSAFLEAKKKRQAFETAASKMTETAIPEKAKAPANEKRREALAAVRQEVNKEITALRRKLNEQLGTPGNTAAKEDELKEFQAKRTVKEAELRITPESEKLERDKLQSELKTHRIEAQQKVIQYDSLRQETEALIARIDAHTKATAQFIKDDVAGS